MARMQQSRAGFWQRLHEQIDSLYNGTNIRARNFRWGLLALDSIAILYFLVASFFHYIDELHIIEEGIGIIYLLEFSSRLFISSRRLRDIFHPLGLADLIVIFSLDFYYWTPNHSISKPNIFLSFSLSGTRSSNLAPNNVFPPLFR